MMTGSDPTPPWRGSGRAGRRRAPAPSRRRRRRQPRRRRRRRRSCRRDARARCGRRSGSARDRSRRRCGDCPSAWPAPSWANAGRSFARPSKLVPGARVLVVVEHHCAVGIGDRDQRPRSNRPSAIAAAARCWLCDGERVDVLAAEALDGGDRGRPRCPAAQSGTCSRKAGLPPSIVDGRRRSGSTATSTRRRRRPRDPGRRCPRPSRRTVIACWPEPQNRFSVIPGHRLGPAGQQQREPGDVVAVVTGQDSVAGHHVVDLGRFEPGRGRRVRADIARTAPAGGCRVMRRRHGPYLAAFGRRR